MTDTTKNDEPTTPTREQIAATVHDVVENGEWSDAEEMEPLLVDAVLALFSQPSQSITVAPSCGPPPALTNQEDA